MATKVEFRNRCCAKENDGKPWKYLLIPHDAITDPMTLAGLAAKYTRMNTRQGSGG